MRKRIDANELSSLDIPEGASKTKILSFLILGFGIALSVFGIASLSTSKEISAKTSYFSKKINHISEVSESFKGNNYASLDDIENDIRAMSEEVGSLNGKTLLTASLNLNDYTKLLEATLSQSQSILSSNGQMGSMRALQAKMSEISPQAQSLAQRIQSLKPQFSSPTIFSFAESVSRFAAYSESEIGFTSLSKIDYDLRNMAFSLKQIRDQLRPQDYNLIQKDVEYITSYVYSFLPQVKTGYLTKEESDLLYSLLRQIKDKNTVLSSESNQTVYVSYGVLVVSLFIIFIGIVLSSSAVTASIANLNEKSKRSLVRYTGIQDSIKNMESSVKGASEGDLTVFSQTENDETSDLADGFNQLIIKFKNFLIRTRKISTQVDDSVRDARIESEKFISLSKTQNEAIVDTEKFLSEVLEIIKGVDSDTQSSAYSTSSAMNVVEDGTLAIQESALKMDSIRQNIQSTSKHIKQLGERSQEIGEIVDILGSFSEQVNVLSLNAAIEASRAGEKGKGFKVIAEEISALSDRTELSLKKISTLVEAIQSETRGAIKAMELSTNHVVGSAYVTEVAGSSLNSIRTVLDILDSMMSTIANNSSSQKSKIESLILSAHNLKGRNESIIDGFKKLSDNISNIKSVTENISVYSKEFKT